VILRDRCTIWPYILAWVGIVQLLQWQLHMQIWHKWLEGLKMWGKISFLIDHLFSTPALYGNFLAKTINLFGIVTPNQKGILRDFRNELKMRQDDIKTRVRDDLTAIVQKNKWNLNMLTNMYCHLAEDNFCDKCCETSHSTRLYQHMEYVDKSDRMTNTPSAERWGNGRNSIFPSPGSFNSEQFYLHHFLWFKIIM
jgi:hypothetical protein